MLARDALAAAHAALPEDDYVLVMAAFATIVGLASTALALCGAGGVAVRRIPGPVKAGFKLGFGCAVVSSQCATALFRGGKARLREAAGDDAAWAGPSRAAAAAAAAGLGGAPQVVRLAWAAGHPGAWDWDVAALSAVVVVGTLRGKALLPRRAPPGLEVLVLVGLATGLSAAGFYAGGVVGAPPAGAGGARSLAVAPWDLPFRRLVDLCYGGSVAAPRDARSRPREGDRAGRGPRSPSRRSSSPPSTSSRACRCAVRSRRKTATRGPVRKSVTRGPALIESIPRRRGRPTASSRRRASRRSRPARSGAGPAARR